MSGICSAHKHYEKGCPRCEAMSETYRTMCSTEPMRGILAGLWKPEIGDIVLTEFGEDMIHGRALSYKGDVCVGCDRVIPHQTLIWLPREGDLMEMLLPYVMNLLCDHKEAVVILPPREHFRASTVKESLLLAFAWTQGLRWEDGKWRER